ncbi:hypothetical protein COT64_03395 [Candidatus Shapirobacteria bacterium CG09_land_8_20_14_0_10_39_12]|uniref:Ribbon-helix-helix protein CopG domain-containing protein n=1 Tax=Candidatus Shapirobacteria bacterium CG09_land_8_20_14_0_10_39_12 TaxID=1974885 RepID=A0A2H0WNR3_9BACT|nr:MAG: hypothetical protein COT64_03395 [Candidatus Shapirobacteria bacterium CG09_land_8_20_14_0_10_39_12]
MTTVTISLPDSVARQLDKEISQKGFATRSEFIRSLLRRHFGNEEELKAFSLKPIEEIKLELAKTGKYDQKFIESVTSGLMKSSPYAS